MTSGEQTDQDMGASAKIAESLTDAQLRCLKVLDAEFKIPPRGHAYWAGTMLYGDKLTRFRYVDTRTSNKRQYALTPLGLSVKRAASAIEARQGGDVKQVPSEGRERARTPNNQGQSVGGEDK